MEYDTIFIISLEAIIAIFAVFASFRFVQIYRRKKKLRIKTPKVRGRSYLRDDQLGTVLGVGYAPIGLEKYQVDVMTRDGHVFSVPMHKDELEPENSVHAFAGARPSIWRRKTASFPNIVIDSEKKNLQKENIEMKNQKIINKVKMRVLMNEAATVPDKIDDMTKELMKIGKSSDIKVLK